MMMQDSQAFRRLTDHSFQYQSNVIVGKCPQINADERAFKWHTIDSRKLNRLHLTSRVDHRSPVFRTRVQRIDSPVFSDLDIKWGL